MITTSAIFLQLTLLLVQLAIPLACIYTVYRIFKAVSSIKIVFAKSCYYLALIFPILAICFIYLYNYTHKDIGFGGGVAFGFILNVAFGLSIISFIIGGVYHLYRIFGRNST